MCSSVLSGLADLLPCLEALAAKQPACVSAVSTISAYTLQVAMCRGLLKSKHIELAGFARKDTA